MTSTREHGGGPGVSQRESESRAPGPPDASVAPPPAREADEGLVVEDLLVEDVSIDGMCGVY